MSDADQTLISDSSSFQSKKSRNPLLIIGGIGCLLVICAALLIGGGAFFTQNGQLNQMVATLLEQLETPPPTTETSESDATATPTEANTVEPSTTTTPSETETVTVTDTETPESDTGDSLPVATEPEIGRIIFALGATPDAYEPIDPGLTFTEGITEIHAIFEYDGMSDDFTWERVWYLDGEEILRNEAMWNGDVAGRFDYFIDAGGEPLFPGEWLLELYVEDDLIATGEFTIEAVSDETLVNDATGDADVADSAGTRANSGTPAPTATTEVTVTPTLAPTQVRPPTSRGGGTYQMVYTKWDGGQHNLYVSDTNGSNEQFLLSRAAGPSWTPDGGRIFFYGQEGVDRQVVDDIEYVFDGISNGIVSMGASPLPKSIDQITLFQGLDWKQGTARTTNVSPNGQMVAFDARPGGGDYRIFFLGTEDNQQFRFEILGEQADWSPDSEKIVYRSGRGGSTGLWISNRDDSGHTLITTGGSDSFPAWSPDGQKIVFSRDEGGDVDLYLINPDGSGLQRLTDAPGPDTLPVYTPSGDIVFRSARSGRWGIWKMSGAGDNQTEIIADANVGPDWTFSRMDVR